MQHVRLENFLCIDIETVAEAPEFSQLNQITQNLWTDKVKRMLPEGATTDSFYEQRAGVMAEFSKIVCISVGYFKRVDDTLTFRVKSFYQEKETDLLKAFITLLNQIEIVNNKWVFTGHNIKEFDIPFICRRLLINGISMPEYLDFQNIKPWDSNIVDTFQYWRFGDYKNYTSLKLLAHCLGVPTSKDDIDGSMVGEVYWKEKNLSRIVTYCQKDVVVVANIILKFKGLPLLEEDEVVVIE